MFPVGLRTPDTANRHRCPTSPRHAVEQIMNMRESRPRLSVRRPFAAFPGAKVYTDEAKVYKSLKEFFDHESVNHSVSEYAREMAHTNGMEAFWALLKRGFNGTFHHISPQHLHRYVNEFAGRHNIRDLDTLVQMTVIAQGMVGKRLKYKESVA